jgi:hypothetical protein
MAILGKLYRCQGNRKSPSGKCGRRAALPGSSSYCGDYKCAHSVVIDASGWGDDVRLSDLEPRFTCQVCGHRGAAIRPVFEPARMGTDGIEQVAPRAGPPRRNWNAGPSQPLAGAVSHSDSGGRFLFETKREKLARTGKQLRRPPGSSEAETIRRLVEIGLKAKGETEGLR